MRSGTKATGSHCSRLLCQPVADASSSSRVRWQESVNPEQLPGEIAAISRLIPPRGQRSLPRAVRERKSLSRLKLVDPFESTGDPFGEIPHTSADSLLRRGRGGLTDAEIAPSAR